MNIPFKKTFQNSLYSYLHVSGHKCRNEIECKEEYKDEYLGKSLPSYESQKFNEINSYLHCSCFLMSNLEKYAISALNDLTKDYELIKWRYEVLANDFNGVGVDKGFKELTFYNATYPAKGFFFPFIETVHVSPAFDFTEISIFGMKEERKDDLLHFLRKKEMPHLEDFLKEGEIFIHVVQGKEYGYFNAFLIKSKHDIDEHLVQFFNAIDAGN